LSDKFVDGKSTDFIAYRRSCNQTLNKQTDIFRKNYYRVGDTIVVLYHLVCREIIFGVHYYANKSNANLFRLGKPVYKGVPVWKVVVDAIGALGYGTGLIP
jgi:hypothetical protein